MERLLKCVLVDDDPDVHQILSDYLKSSDKAVLTHYFEKCSDFLEVQSKIPYDLVLLDCLFPNDNKQGVDVAMKLKEVGKEFVFISAKHHSFIEACRLVGALDAMPKPLSPRRIHECIDRAFQLIIASKVVSKKHELFHVKEVKGGVSICVSNILYARPDRMDSRNKIVRLKKNINYTFMNYKFEEILKHSPDFTMANKFEMISYRIVDGINGEFVLLDQKDNEKIPKSIPLSPLYRNLFKTGFH